MSERKPDDFDWECEDPAIVDKVNAIVAEAERECGPVAAGFCDKVAQVILDWANPQLDQLYDIPDP